MTAGRNDPCPCGSGRKYKKCHLAADTAERDAARADAPSPLHDVDHRLIESIVDFAGRRFPDAMLDEMEDLRSHPEMNEQFAIPWLAYIGEFDGRTAADWFAAERGWSLAKGMAEWLDAQRRSWLSIWEVLEVQRGRGLVLRDELTGEERTVHEVKGSEVAEPHQRLLGRVVDHAGVSTLAGVHPVPMGPIHALDVVGRVRKTLRRKTDVPPERLRDAKIAQTLLTAWSDVVVRLSTRPRMVNQDGDEILITGDRWTIERGSRAEIAARLASLEGAIVEEEGSFVFLRADETVVGTAELDDTTLVTECNSIARADALRERIEAACAGLLGRPMRSHTDLAALADDAEEPDDSDEAGSAETDALIREMKQRHYAGWLDEPLPALAGVTPRDAARTARGRRSVEALLQQIEMMEARSEEAERFDVGWLRRELGME